VKPHSVFLRKGCILSDRFNPLREPCGDNWTLVEEITAPVFDTMIRQAGWHFMWMQARALKGVARRFNAAELDSVQVTKYPGFHVAKVTLQPRHIQQHTSLDIADERHAQAVPAR
jgi:hypothetical protein